MTRQQFNPSLAGNLLYAKLDAKYSAMNVNMNSRSRPLDLKF